MHWGAINDWDHVSRAPILDGSLFDLIWNALFIHEIYTYKQIHFHTDPSQPTPDVRSTLIQCLKRWINVDPMLCVHQGVRHNSEIWTVINISFIPSIIQRNFYFYWILCHCQLYLNKYNNRPFFLFFLVVAPDRFYMFFQPISEYFATFQPHSVFLFVS